MYQKLAYLMRSGPADLVDRMVGTNFGLLALQLIQRGEFGQMVGIQDGHYGHVPVETVISGKRHVDVDRYYDAETYRTKIKKIMGLPMLLN